MTGTSSSRSTRGAQARGSGRPPERRWRPAAPEPPSGAESRPPCGPRSPCRRDRSPRPPSSPWRGGRRRPRVSRPFSPRTARIAPRPSADRERRLGVAVDERVLDGGGVGPELGREAGDFGADVGEPGLDRQPGGRGDHAGRDGGHGGALRLDDAVPFDAGHPDRSQECARREATSAGGHVAGASAVPQSRRPYPSVHDDLRTAGEVN